MNTRLVRFAVWCFLALALFLTLFPYIWIFIASIRPFQYLVRPTLRFTPTFDNWRLVASRPGFGRSIVNSLIVGLAVVAVSIMVATPAAYGFSRFKTGGDVGRLSILGLQMLPPAVLGIPIFLMITKIGLRGSLLGAIIAHLTFILPVVCWFLVGFFDEIPRELEEQAMVDGCTQLRAFLLVSVPLVAPGLAACAIFAFILSWNEFFYSLLLTGGASKTLPVVLGEFWTFRGIELGQMSAAIMVTIIPTLVLSLFIQRRMVRGLSRGALKE